MKEFELSKEDLDKLLEACKPVPYMTDGNGNLLFGDQQTNANNEWKRLGEKYGFVWDSAEPVDGKPMNFLLANPV